MTKLSLADKLGVLFDTISSSKIHILIFLVLLLIGYALTTNKKKTTRTQKVLFLVYIVALGTLLYNYRNNLSNMFDYMMNNLFIIIYFPNLAIYLFAIIVTNIIMWSSILNNKVSRIIKNINVTIYCMITYILVLVLNIVKENNLDVFVQTSVYSNKEAQALIELSSTIFITWVIFLIVYKLVKPLFTKNKAPQIVKQQVQVVEQKVMSPTVTNVKPIPEIAHRNIEKPYREIEPPKKVYGMTSTKKSSIFQNIEAPAMVIRNTPVKKIEQPAPTPTIEKSYQQIIPPRTVRIDSPRVVVDKPKADTKAFDDLLTLEDYKLLLNILKEQKQNQIKTSDDKEEAKFHELQQLYRI